MMEDLKVTDKKSEIGYYSGVVVSICSNVDVDEIVLIAEQDSLFAVCQLFTILQWGRLSGTFASFES